MHHHFKNKLTITPQLKMVFKNICSRFINNIFLGETKKTMVVITRSFCRTKTLLENESVKILKSKYPDVKIPNLSLCEYIWKDYESFLDSPAIVSFFSLILFCSFSFKVLCIHHTT